MKPIPKLIFVLISMMVLLNLVFPESLYSATSQPRAVPEKEKYGGTLRIAIGTEPKSLDSRYLGSGWDANPGFQQIYESLVDFGSKASRPSVPVLAESWEQLDDVTWLVRIRKGVKYHNGRELIAEDIKTQIGWSMQPPKGWRPPRQKSASGPIKQIEVIDKYTMKITLKQPEELFVPYIMRWGHNGYSPPELVEKWGKEYTLHPTGTGPFKFVEWISGDHVTIERFDDYWGKKPYLERVIIRTIPDSQTRFIALQKGEVDISDIPLTSLPIAKKDPNLIIYEPMSTFKPDGGGFDFNLRRWPMNQLKFRQAIAMGADWEKIAKLSVPNGRAVIRRSFLKGSWAYDPKAEKIVPSYNPEKAKKLIKEVEKEAGRPIPRLYALTGDTGAYSNFLTIGESELKKIGISLDLHFVPFHVAKDIRQRDPKMEWDINLWREAKGAGVHPLFVFESFRADSRKAPDGKNLFGYDNPKFDELFTRGNKGMKDRKKLQELFQEMERILLTDIPRLPIWDEPVCFGVNKKVHDFYSHDSLWIFLVSSYNNIWIEK